MLHAGIGAEGVGHRGTEQGWRTGVIQVILFKTCWQCLSGRDGGRERAWHLIGVKRHLIMLQEVTWTGTEKGKVVEKEGGVAGSDAGTRALGQAQGVARW